MPTCFCGENMQITCGVHANHWRLCLRCKWPRCALLRSSNVCVDDLGPSTGSECLQVHRAKHCYRSAKPCSHLNTRVDAAVDVFRICVSTCLTCQHFGCTSARQLYRCKVKCWTLVVGKTMLGPISATESAVATCCNRLAP